jgi:hypothetical protein
MFRNRRGLFFKLGIPVAILFFITSCADLPLIGKKKEEKPAKQPAGPTVSIEGMETIKGVNPARPETASPSKKGAAQPAPTRKEADIRVSSLPSKPLLSPSLPFFQTGFKKKVAVLDFENNTTYTEEKIGEAVGKRLSDKLEASQRVVVMDKTVVSEMLNREGTKVENLLTSSIMKRAHQSLGIQAFAFGTVTEVSLLSSKTSETAEEEATSATSRIEIRLIDASTGNPLRTFVGRSPIFGTRETGENSRGKAVLKAIELSLDEILDGFLRQLDLLDWTTTIARMDGDSLYVNAGKLSGLRIGDMLEVFEPGKEIIHPLTKLSLGWTTGQLKGVLRVTELFGVDAATGKVIEGRGFAPNDVVKSPVR